MFVGVVYREQLASKVPGVFRNPIDTDTQTYAQIMVFVPRRRLQKIYPGRGNPDETFGGIPGERIPRTPPPAPTPPPPEDPDAPVPWTIGYQSRRWYPHDWNLVNQNWTMQLVPATTPTIPAILSTPPEINGVTGIDTPDLLSLSDEDFRWLSHH